jgi:glycerol-3-phosphate dehydrogenase
VRAGLTLYDALALFRNVSRHRVVNAGAVTAIEPALRQSGLRGGAVYFDATTDDARLTLANARAAHDAGATVVSRVEVNRLLLDTGAVRGACARDVLTGRTIDITARMVVNATGPWSDTIRRLADPDATPSVRGTKGVHIALPRARVGNTGALTLLSPIDGRVFFVLPAGQTTIVGTTDTDYDGSLDAVRATPADVAYLLRSANAYFPATALVAADVVAAWAGIRPLIGGDAHHPDALSREHAVTFTAPGLITVTGGKLTTYRVMAHDVANAAQRALGQPVRPADTAHLPLPGGAITSMDAERDDAEHRTGSRDLATHLVFRYGTEWRDVWSLAEHDRGLARPLASPLPDIAAELQWAVDHEMALSLGDLLIRRLHLAFETADHGRAVAQAIAAQFGWQNTEVERYAAEAHAIFGV